MPLILVMILSKFAFAIAPRDSNWTPPQKCWEFLARGIKAPYVKPGQKVILARHTPENEKDMIYSIAHEWKSVGGRGRVNSGDFWDRSPQTFRLLVDRLNQVSPSFSRKLEDIFLEAFRNEPELYQTLLARHGLDGNRKRTFKEMAKILAGLVLLV